MGLSTGHRKDPASTLEKVAVQPGKVEATLYESGISRETEPIECAHAEKEIYFKKLAHMIMDTWQVQNLQDGPVG